MSGSSNTSSRLITCKVVLFPGENVLTQVEVQNAHVHWCPRAYIIIAYPKSVTIHEFSKESRLDLLEHSPNSSDPSPYDLIVPMAKGCQQFVGSHCSILNAVSKGLSAHIT